MTSALGGVRVLILSPAFEPVRIVSWQRAMLLSFGEKVEVLEHYPDVFVHSVNAKFAVPAVIRMTKYFFPRRVRRRTRFTRHHVFARDDFQCQYCRESFAAKELTLDHVVPIVQGGRTSWSNIVACCMECNQRKGSLTPQEAGLKLLKTPVEPKVGFLPDLLLYKGSKLPESWRPFLRAG